MSHSNSSLNCFTNCMAKYWHTYINHTPPCKPPSPHLTFGTMAHEVLYKAGELRDISTVATTLDYDTVIPSEVLYSDLKETFGIRSWANYFTSVIKEVAKYEHNCITELASSKEKVEIYRELKLQLSVEELKGLGYNISQPLVGVIDLLLITKDSAIILDYKFSTTKKTQADFDMNSQLPLYAWFVHWRYDIPLQNIQVGYIDIPKTEFCSPMVLTNGTLSRAKSQNTSQELYKLAIYTVHGDDPYYNCEPGGYYYDCYCSLALNKPAYINKQYLDFDVYSGIISDIMDTAVMVDKMIANNDKFLHKYDSYSCSACEYLPYCKPWLKATFGKE